MKQERIQELTNELMDVMGTALDRDELIGTVEKVLMHHPSNDSDENIAASVGLPVKAVSIIRKIVKELAGEESQQKSRLSVHSHHLRFRVADPNCEIELRKDSTPRYPYLVKNYVKPKEIK